MGTVADTMELHQYGFYSGSSDFLEPPRLHRHNEIELIFVEGNSLIFFFGSTPLLLQPGDFGAFWAAVPHRVVSTEPGAKLHWIHFPLAWMLDRKLPARLIGELLRGDLLFDATGGQRDFDALLFSRWHGLLEDRNPEHETIVVLEVEARLRQLWMKSAQREAKTDVEPQPQKFGKEIRQAEQMACYIAQHFQEPLAIADIAASVDLHPNYAMTLFRKRLGTSLTAYVTEHRMSHAKRLLITTDLSVLEILLEAGFGSLTQFYAIFKKQCGLAPLQYRQRHRRESVPRR